MEMTLLQQAIAEDRVQPCDLLIAKRIQPQGGWLGLFIARSFRKGFLSVSCSQEGIHPDVSTIFADDAGNLLPQVSSTTIAKAIQDEVTTKSYSNLFSDPPNFGLPFAQALREQVLLEIGRLTSAAPFLPIPPCTELLEHLTDQQCAAIRTVSTHAVSIITGGPGTGKTFTAGVWLRHAASCFPRLRVALCAPTGRAVQALQASILRACGTPNFLLDAKTIHSFIHASNRVLPYHIVIVDECSMIDAGLFLNLLRRLHSGVRLIMLGDPDQLPPIDPGQPFVELTTRKSVPVCTLNTCQRTSSPVLTSLASLLRSGDKEAFFSCLHDNNLIHACRTQEAWREAEAMLTKEVATTWSSVTTIQEASGLLRRSVVLTPARKGYFGAEALNERLSVRSVFEPIVVAKNSYDLGVMNGDMGVLERGVMMHADGKTIPSVLCPHIERAYAMTVHKSQGSEFDDVFVIIPPNVAIDTRLLYTAITRARKALRVLCVNNSL